MCIILRLEIIRRAVQVREKALKSEDFYEISVELKHNLFPHSLMLYVYCRRSEFTCAWRGDVTGSF